MPDNKIKIFKDGNLIRLHSTPVTRKVAAKALTYMRNSMTYTGGGKEYSGTPMVHSIPVECFVERRMAGKDYLLANAGYLHRLKKEFKELGYRVLFKDLRPINNRAALKPYWKNIEGFELRPGQREALEAYVAAERGQICWATGVGKSFLIPLMCRLHPKASIAVTTRFIPTLLDLYHNLSQHLPSVGIECSKKKKTDRRVMCYGAGSLHKADISKTDILIADEVHELATDKMFQVFAKFRFSKMFGLSANFEDRMDNADFELEGVFGPLIASMSYQDGVKQGLIVPIKVLWQNANLSRNPGLGLEGDVAVKRANIWRNEERNQLIADLANNYADDQVLITVKTFDHACHLKKLLPDYTLVYSSGDDKEGDIDKYVRWKLLKPDEPRMTLDRQEMLKRNFETGKLKKAIATTVWNRGVNFKNLQVLIRADAGASPIDDTQIPGRLSRLGSDGNKGCGVLIDLLDQFDDNLARKAKTRMRNYKGKGWTNVLPDPPKRVTARR